MCHGHEVGRMYETVVRGSRHCDADLHVDGTRDCTDAAGHADKRLWVWSLRVLGSKQHRVLMCQFKGSCDKHDTCYARCDKGGDLFGSPLCKDEPSRKERRKVCDAALQTNIITANNDRSPCRVYTRLSIESPYRSWATRSSMVLLVRNPQARIR